MADTAATYETCRRFGGSTSASLRTRRRLQRHSEGREKRHEEGREENDQTMGPSCKYIATTTSEPDTGVSYMR